MPKIYQKAVSVISKPYGERTDFECHELIQWFKNKSKYFQSLKPDIIKDVIRHCMFEQKVRDDVIIKQGESGDRLYIILQGKVSIYVLPEQEKDDNEIKHLVEQACAKKTLDRSNLGKHVWTSGEGQAFGEVALIKEDCVRTASVVVDEDTDLMVVDRSLYNRSVRDVLVREFALKTEFVETNPLFCNWAQKLRKQTAIALKIANINYGGILTRQGASMESMYFIRSGEVETTIDHFAFRVQFPQLWSEMEELLPELLDEGESAHQTPYGMLRRKRGRKAQQMCLLGENEHIGTLEYILGLDSCIETTVVTQSSEVMVLNRQNYERIFSRKSAVTSLEMLKENWNYRLFLYIHRSQRNMPFLKFLSLKLQVSDLKILTKEKERRLYLHRIKRAQRRRKPRPATSINRDFTRDESEFGTMLKRLHMPNNSRAKRLPEISSSIHVIQRLDKRIGQWLHTSLYAPPEPVIPTPITPRTRKYINEEINLEVLLRGQTFARSKTMRELPALNREETLRAMKQRGNTVC